MVTNVEQLIPNAKGKDYPRETRVGLECICQYMMCFQSLSPSFIGGTTSNFMHGDPS